MSDEEWNWQFRKPAKRTYDDLDKHAQDRITDKLDEIVTDQWRDPDDYLEPLTGAPYSKLRIGQFRLGAECNNLVSRWNHEAALSEYQSPNFIMPFITGLDFLRVRSSLVAPAVRVRQPDTDTSPTPYTGPRTRESAFRASRARYR